MQNCYCALPLILPSYRDGIYLVRQPIQSDACNFGALAVIYPLLQRMKVAEIIDQHVPADPRAEFPYSKVLSLLLAARLYRPTALSNVGAWAADSGADILWDMPLEKINDDRLARRLDAFFPPNVIRFWPTWR